MKNDIEIPSYFTSLFNSAGQPVTVTIYDKSTDEEIEYAKIYVDILKGYRDYYEILDVMMDFYEGLSDTPGVIFDIERNQIGVALLSYEEEKKIDDDDGEVYITQNRVYEFTFQSGEQVTVKFWHTYSSDGEMIDGTVELISILDGDGDEIDPDDIDGLEGPSQYIHSLEEPHEDEWMKDLCSFMNDELEVQKRFYETSESFRALVHNNYYKLVDDEELEFKLSAGWEIRDEERAICRWFCAWKSVGTGKNKIAGVIAGYSGGGGFEVERFYGEIQSREFNSLWIDYTDRVSGEEIDFYTLNQDILDICVKGNELLWEWNDNDEWGESDQVLLLNGKKRGLQREEDMLLLQKGRISEEEISVVYKLCELAGLTAGPVA